MKKFNFILFLHSLLVTFDGDYNAHKIVSVSQNFDKWAEDLK